MERIIAVIFGIISAVLLLMLAKSAVLVFTANAGYVGVFIGILFPAIVAILVAAHAYSEIKQQ
jgi:hypothetical protein